MSSLEERAAWGQVEKAAAAWYTSPPTVQGASRQGLHEAVLTYANAYLRARGHTPLRPAQDSGASGWPPGAVRGTGGRTLRSGHVMPFGRSKGAPIEEAERGDIAWVLERLEENLKDSSRARFHANDRRLATALRLELESR